MTRSEQARQELADMGIEVFCCPGLVSRRAIASDDGLIGLNPGVETEQEKCTVLTHEKWHFKLGAFYRADAPYLERLQKEAAVNRAVIRELVPKDTLAALLRSGLTVEEAAERLGVTETQIWEAWRFYRDTDPHYCRSG